MRLVQAQTQKPLSGTVPLTESTRKLGSVEACWSHIMMANENVDVPEIARHMDFFYVSPYLKYFAALQEM